MKTIHITFLLLAILTLKSAKAQNVVTDTSATVVSYWQKGDKINYVMIKTNEAFTNKNLRASSSSTANITITVVDATEKSYTIHWKYISVKEEDKVIDPAQGPGNAKLSEGITLKYKTDELGSFTEPLNWEEVRNIMYKAIDEMAKTITNEDKKKLIADTKKKFGTKEAIEQVVCRDLPFFHAPYGIEYKLKRLLTEEIMIPNFFGGEPFPAIYSVTLNEINTKNNYCTVSINQTVDREKAAEIMKKQFNASKEEGETIPYIDIIDKSLYQVELESGWIKKAEYNRLVDANGSKRTQKFSLIKVN